MSEEQLPTLIEETKAAYGNFIKKPRMSDKLLSKPPFRFIHDVVTEVSKATGFATGLYSDPEPPKDKEGKIEYLNRIIAAVGFADNGAVAVRPGKIVAGHEPWNTNVLLLKLAHVSQNTSAEDSEVIVQKVLSGEVPSPPGEEAPPPKKERKKERQQQEERPAEAHATEEGGQDEEERRRQEKEEKRRRRKEKEERKKRQEAEAEAAAAVAEGEAQAQAQAEPPAAQAEEEGEEERKRKEKEERRKKRKEKEERKKQQEEQERARKEKEEAEAEAEPAPAARQSEQQGDDPVGMDVDGGQERFGGDGEEEGGDGREMYEPPAQGVQLERPRTALPPPPKLPSNVVQVEKTVMKTDLGNTTSDAPAVAGGIIVDGEDDDDDLEDMIVDGNAMKKGSSQPQEGEHGALVNEILGVAKETKDHDGTKDQDDQTRMKASGGIILSSKLKSNNQGKAVSREELRKLRDSIQVVCRSTNPLGKCLDYVQEDLDNMNKELQQWRKEHQEQSSVLEQEIKNTEGALQPLEDQISQLDNEIEEELSKIHNQKAVIFKNEAHIRNALRMVIKG